MLPGLLEIPGGTTELLKDVVAILRSDMINFMVKRTEKESNNVYQFTMKIGLSGIILTVMILEQAQEGVLEYELAQESIICMYTAACMMMKIPLRKKSKIPNLNRLLDAYARILTRTQ